MFFLKILILIPRTFKWFITEWITGSFDLTQNDRSSSKKFTMRLEVPSFCSPGRMISTKGLHVLIKAMPKVIKEVKDTHFVFTGGGNFSPYRQMINQMKIPSRNYNFVGYVRDFEDLPGLYSIASVFAAPTLYENFPFRVLENMSCQNAIVATKIVGIPEMITDGFNGLLVPPSNSDKLAEKIVELINDRGLAKKLGQNTRRTIEEQFTFQIFANKTKDAYTWVMNYSLC